MAPIPNPWMARAARWIRRLLGISFDLSGLKVDEFDVDLDLNYGRE